MLNIVKYRFVFLLISLIIIVPGTLALLIFHLNLGTDFTGGSNLNLRPQRALTADQVTTLLKPLNLENSQVIIGNNTQIAAGSTAWIKLTTALGTNNDTIQGDIKTALNKQYPDSKLSYTFWDVPQAGGKTFALVTVSGFKTTPTESAINTALKGLPKAFTPVTTDSNSTPTPVATTAPTATAAATATPTATATAVATTTATATATTPTPAATATATPTAAPVGTVPVEVDTVTLGSTTATINILTHTPLVTTAQAKVGEVDIAHIQEALLKGSGAYVQVIDSSVTGGAVAADTTNSSILAVLAASVLIVLYVWFSFRKVPKSWRYGISAIIALLHDVLVVMGIFAILGHFFNIQVDALFITALLTVVGFSVHDTIVVFDRIRENMTRRTTENFEEVVNASLVQTMARSLNTSLTVLFTMLALTIFTTGIDSIHNFTLALLIGIFSGTYSSIFNASMILVIWEKGELGFWRFNREKQTPDGKRKVETRELAGSRR